PALNLFHEIMTSDTLFTKLFYIIHAIALLSCPSGFGFFVIICYNYKLGSTKKFTISHSQLTVDQSIAFAQTL
ncbi:MAG: hypothetical protein JW953_09575, partial [Anaerolineae bacterium]|nr:hypothetical protein [Anaerolineae bacterium]